MTQGYAQKYLTERNPPQPDVSWTRNPEWEPMPAWSGEDRIVVLQAIYPGANRVRVTVAGAYTVDWGDGSAPANFASGAVAEKNLAWADERSRAPASS